MSELKEKIARERDEALVNAGSQVKAAILKFLADFPAVEKLSFKSYTPGFNDGDPCVVRIDGPYVKLANDDTEDDRDDDDDCEMVDGFRDAYGLEQYPDMEKAAKELESVLDVWPEAVEQIFGESQKVVIDQNGKVETEDYYCGY